MFIFVLGLGLAFLGVAWYGSYRDAQNLESYAEMLESYEAACREYFDTFR